MITANDFRRVVEAHKVFVKKYNKETKERNKKFEERLEKDRESNTKLSNIYVEDFLRKNLNISSCLNPPIVFYVPDLLSYIDACTSYYASFGDLNSVKRYEQYLTAICVDCLKDRGFETSINESFLKISWQTERSTKK
jgi:hypothetical protein